MKNLLLFFLCILWAFSCGAQAKPYKPNPKAKKLEDSAIHVFTTSDGSKGSYTRVNNLLDAALKADPKWYEGWSNLLAFLGRTDQFEKCLVTAKKMVQLFPKEPDALFNCGIMQYKTGHPADAMICFAKLLKFYNDLLAKDPKNPHYNDLLTQKGIVLILMDRDKEGKTILRRLYTDETDPYKKSFIAFYVNKSKNEIIEDKVPGK